MMVFKKVHVEVQVGEALCGVRRAGWGRICS